MMHEVRSIPPAPRRVRLKSLVAHRWPLFAVGGSLVVLGMLIAWLMFLQSGGKMSDSARLDHDPKAVVDGRILTVRRAGTWDGKQWDEVLYEFTWINTGLQTTLSRTSFVAAGTCAVGSSVQIEVLVDEPNVSRVLGGILAQDWRWLHAPFWIGTMALPGAFLLLAWLAGFFQLRRVLVHGDVSVGRVTAIANVRFVLPEMLRVTYEFRDHHAVARVNSHWVRAHSPLGERLERQMHTGWLEPMPVLHDRRMPQWNRMLLPRDFLPQTSHHALPANGIT
ncbi:MAG TPA: hypothetical protein VFD82_18085 [Planctomycetota bacterium]|nr:hypothetical protein [Planctomycetota bacterium]